MIRYIEEGPTPRNPPAPTFAHPFNKDYIHALIGTTWVIAGGSSSNDTLLNDTNMLDLSQPVPNWIALEDVHPPTPLGDAPAAVIGDTMFVPGGIERESMCMATMRL